MKPYPCPQCGTPLEWDTRNEFRPFCSASCKNRDFIGWADEKRRIPLSEDTLETDLDSELGDLRQ